MSPAVVIDAIRTPIGRADARAGCFRDVRSDELSASLITPVMRRWVPKPSCRVKVAAAPIQSVKVWSVRSLRQTMSNRKSSERPSRPLTATTSRSSSPI